VRVLGVDDFAFRKGFSYGTILCDLKRGPPIDLLPERSKESFQDWLVNHPGVEVVSRDRGEQFAQGGAAGAPDASQVADRWHLLANLRDALARWLGRTSAQWRPHLPDGRQGAATEGEVLPRQKSSPKEQLRQARRQQRLKRYDRLGNCMAAAGTIGELVVVWGFTPIPSVSSLKPIRFPSESRRIASARRNRSRDI
jgi:transposase